MFKRLIKKYKYVDKKDIIHVHPERIIKSGKYSTADFAQFDPTAKMRQKKKIEEQQARSSPVNISGIKDKSCRSSISSSHAKTSESILSSDNSQADSTSLNRTSAQEFSQVFESRLKSETEKAYNQGYQQGRASGLAVVDAKAEQITRLINNVLIEFDKSSAKFFKEIETVAIDMSVHLAEKIIGDAVTMIPDIIKTNVDKCINLLAGAGTVEIKINPTDYETIKAYLPNLDKKFDNKYTFVLEPDQNISRGGCLVEFEGSVIDGRIETQLEKIKQHMELLT